MRIMSDHKGALISPCGQYRYSLWRESLSTLLGTPRLGRVCFVMLNPSTADAEHDDPTIGKCKKYAQAWGFGSLEVVNLFAWRATDPADLYAAAQLGNDVVGPENDAHITSAARRSQLVVVAWGTKDWLDGADRPRQVVQLIQAAGAAPHCLVQTKSGQPGHPLYLRDALRPVPWPIRKGNR